MKRFEAALSAGLGDWPQGTVFLASVSGGADSTAMLAGLAALRRERAFGLYCLHVEHGIRPVEESEGDAEAVRELCGKLELPCRIVHIARGRIAEAAGNWGTGIEAAARFFRRRVWLKEARRLGAARVLAAHTRDDVLELLLMRFLRGSGPAGLAGIPRERGCVLRPLLALGREDVLGYLEERGIAYRTDSTNADTRYLRNRIRLRLIPRLNELFPGWQKPVLGLAETQAMSACFLKAEAEKRIPWHSGGPGFKAGAEAAAGLVADGSVFFAEPPIIREEALFLAADKLAPQSGNEATLRRGVIRRFAAGGLGAADLGPLRLESRSGMVNIWKKGKDISGRGFSLLIKGSGVYNLKGISVRIGRSGPAGKAGGFFSADLPLVFRPVSKDDHVFCKGKRRNAARLVAEKTAPGFPCQAPEGDHASRYTDSICAEDGAGIAALIGGGPGGTVVWRREEGGPFLVSLVSFEGAVFCGGGISPR
ncbi:MAG: tRNA lysidine(34) synthetase TilS [Treponema sp.]|jgi:tRNA(Ile)-lysidine synthase|nr:tRNA lysidine(34) synthetase TilS [Treponema sp.]